MDAITTAGRQPSVLGLITARGGSRSIPRKNVLPLAGKPMIAWTIEAAQESRSVNRLLVSTDDEEIGEVAREYGAEVPFLRPPELAQDASSHLSVVAHALDWAQEEGRPAPDYVLLLQPTSPLRLPEDIDCAVALAVEHEADSVVGVTVPHHHPRLARQVGEGGMLERFTAETATPGRSDARRQALPAVYVLNGAIYLTRTIVLRAEGTFEPRRTFPYIMPPERSLEADDLWEFHLIELLMREKHGIGG